MGCVRSLPAPDSVPAPAAALRQLTHAQREVICRGINARDWVAYARATGLTYRRTAFGIADDDVGYVWLRGDEAPKDIDSVGSDVWLRHYQLTFSWDDTMLQVLLRHWYATGNLPRNWSRCRWHAPEAPMATPRNLFYTFRWHDVCAGDHVAVAPRESLDAKDVFADALAFVEKQLTKLRRYDPVAARDAAPQTGTYYDNQWIFYIRRHPARGLFPADEHELEFIPTDKEALLELTIDEQIALYRWQEHVLRWALELEAGRRPRTELAAFDWVPIDFVVTERTIALVRSILADYRYTIDEQTAKPVDNSCGYFPIAVIDLVVAYIEVRLHDTPMRLERVRSPHFQCWRSASVACDGDAGDGLY